MFNQEPVEEQSQICEAPEHEAVQPNNPWNTPKDRNSKLHNSADDESRNSECEKSETDSSSLEISQRKLISNDQDGKLLRRSCSEHCPLESTCREQSVGCDHVPESCGHNFQRSCCSEERVDSVLQVDNGSEVDDSFLQREGSQRRSRRRFRRVNPKGERELITDGQEPAGYNTVGINPSP